MRELTYKLNIQNVRFVLDTHGWQAKIAKELGVTNAVISSWFRGCSGMPDRYLKRLCTLIEKEPKDIIALDDLVKIKEMSNLDLTSNGR
jgi:hypothetical protein